MDRHPFHSVCDEHDDHGPNEEHSFHVPLYVISIKESAAVVLLCKHDVSKDDALRL